MSTTPLNIFFTGATGYIGGSILLRLLEHPKSSTFKITALVRSPEKAQKLESIGVKTIIGDYSNLEKLESSAAEADYVFAVANCDDVPANNAILSGLKKHFEKTGNKPVLIHISGTAVLGDTVNDLAIVGADKAEGRQPGHGREGFYFAENDECALYEMSKSITKSLYQLGLLKSDEVTPLTETEAAGLGQLVSIIGGNTRCRANRARALGWKPTKITTHFFGGIKEELTLLGVGGTT